MPGTLMLLRRKGADLDQPSRIGASPRQVLARGGSPASLVALMSDVGVDGILPFIREMQRARTNAAMYEIVGLRLQERVRALKEREERLRAQLRDQFSIRSGKKTAA